MKLFRQSRNADGWRAIGFQEGEVRFCHVLRPPNTRPIVTMLGAERISDGGVQEALKRLAKEWRDRRAACSTAIGANDYHFLPIDAPNVPAAEFKSAISWLVKDMIDFDHADATIDIVSVPVDKKTSIKAKTIYAILTRTALMGSIQRCFESAELNLKVIDIPEMAQRNIASLLESEGQAIAMLSFNGDGGLLTFSGGGELYLARRIELSLEQLLSANGAPNETALERLALEIQRSLDNFGRHFSWVSLQKLVLAPLGQDGSALISYLASNLDKPVAELDMATVIDFSMRPELNASLMQHKYFLTIGLALRYEEQVL